MSRIRDAAANFLEAGRALGHYERAKADVAYLDECAERGRHLISSPTDEGALAVLAAFRSAADFQRAQLQPLEREALDYRMAAERLIAELESPGGALGRRVLRVIVAARAAWSKP